MIARSLILIVLFALPAMGQQVELAAWRLVEVGELTPEVSGQKSREATLIAEGRQPVGGQTEFPQNATRRVCCQLILRDRAKGAAHGHDMVIRFVDPDGSLLGETKETLEFDGDGGRVSYLVSCGSRRGRPWDLGQYRVEVALDGAPFARTTFTILEPKKWAAARYNLDETLAAGDRYVGQAVGRAFDGWGNYFWRDGARYCGQWQAGQRHGQATLFATDGSRYVGQVREGMCTGGLYVWPDGRVAWSRQDEGGSWRNTEPVLSRVRSFNNVIWNDLQSTLAGQPVAWFRLDSTFARPAELLVYVAYPRAQEFVLHGFRKSPGTATLTTQRVRAPAAAFVRDAVPAELSGGWDGQYVYRLHIRGRQAGRSVRVVLAALAPPARIIGRAVCGDRGEAPEGAQVGCFLSPGTTEPATVDPAKPPVVAVAPKPPVVIDPPRPVGPPNPPVVEDPPKPVEPPKPVAPPKPPVVIEPPKPVEPPKPPVGVEPPKPPAPKPRRPMSVKGTMQVERYCGRYIAEFERTTRPRARNYDVLTSKLEKSAITFIIAPITGETRGTWEFAWTYVAAVETKGGEQGEIRFSFSASGHVVGTHKAGAIKGRTTGTMKIEMTVTGGGAADTKTMTPLIDSAWTAKLDAAGNVAGHLIQAVGEQVGVPFTAKAVVPTAAPAD
ncbi:hypothetical protein HQ560_00245 [bacterium]|nr:hypothetical protein [bacterium]